VNDREIEMDNGWVDTYCSTSKSLYKAGYSVGGYLDNGVARFVLYRVVDTADRFECVHEFNTREELNNMVKLLLPPEEK
jgi:hypothetical protein